MDESAAKDIVIESFVRRHTRHLLVNEKGEEPDTRDYHAKTKFICDLIADDEIQKKLCMRSSSDDVPVLQILVQHPFEAVKEVIKNAAFQNKIAHLKKVKESKMQDWERWTSNLEEKKATYDGKKRKSKYDTRDMNDSIERHERFQQNHEREMMNYDNTIEYYEQEHKRKKK